ncbi:Hydroxyethylthiazole kinase [Triticum urartu]|uniref:hydroxyethylthiazole kinase n=1 Tax=Triticum urartu TaxID=4572 RepID=M7Z588_TRIUA|nr:Hydroxyethylthiazole kinase [Triticum urartu]
MSSLRGRLPDCIISLLFEDEQHTYQAYSRLEYIFHHAADGTNTSGQLQGVDSSHDSGEALQAAKALARSSGAVVAVSGAVDFITDGEQVVSASNGVPMMQKITATGCAVTALIAAFVGADPSDALAAAACALAIFGLAGEIGMESAKGPASLRMHLIDALYGLDEQTVTSGVKIALVP